MKIIKINFFGVFVLCLCAVVRAQQVRKTELANPPEQPLTGPGGKEYAHADMVKSVYGKEENQYWIFEPAKPTPKSAPLIVFNHGWAGVLPQFYGGWIKHLVRRGNIVVFPRYQTNFLYPPSEITPNAIKAVKDAIKRLGEDGHVKPDLDKFAVVGHSAGGQITANMAALAAKEKLPLPKAIMCVQPGNSWTPNEIRIPLEDMSKIDKQTLILTLVGDQDKFVFDIDAKRIFKESKQVPAENKNFIMFISDCHGKPSIVADHFSCVDKTLGKSLGSSEDEDDSKEGDFFLSMLPSKVDKGAINFYGYWKLFDALCDAAFYGKNREYALGATPEQRFMGKWSDGTPVKELKVTAKPE